MLMVFRLYLVVTTAVLVSSDYCLQVACVLIIVLHAAHACTCECGNL